MEAANNLASMAPLGIIGEEADVIMVREYIYATSRGAGRSRGASENLSSGRPLIPPSPGRAFCRIAARAHDFVDCFFAAVVCV